MQLRSESCAEKVNPSFLGYRQQHANSSVSTSIHFIPESENEKAGLMVFQNEKHFYFLCQSLENNESVIQLYQSGEHKNGSIDMKLISAQKYTKHTDDKPLYLKMETCGNVYSFYFGFQPNEWNLLKGDVDARFLSTKIAGGFVGCMYALYATSLGKPSENIVYFDWFEYSGDDEVYKQFKKKSE